MADNGDISVFDVIKLRDFETIRAFLYVVVPVVLTALSVNHADLWIGLALAVLAPALSAANSVAGFRTWFYGVLAAGQAVLLGLNLFTDVQVSVWVSVIGAVIGGGVATSRLTTTTRTTKASKPVRKYGA
ncbi:hypothetical protein SEA_PHRAPPUCCINO_197 [Mycobacterium phage Phrappuccino]|uniref:Holin n=1 Tax=Mycobacterium phage Phrappuccino TaxID=2591223 RepID=A0A514DE38_9CAUD|nr:holin [Mycobacterium phage Phrappuccino]QDH91872.1 hypothetical protein SEA_PHRAPPUCCINO_197 [Mycobacterium phage Phrappuccino]QIQ63338.1 hypothetical protein SEA_SETTECANDELA_222 [Mycobacterium phage Settecandela]